MGDAGIVSWKWEWVCSCFSTREPDAADALLGSFSCLSSFIFPPFPAENDAGVCVCEDGAPPGLPRKVPKPSIALVDVPPGPPPPALVSPGFERSPSPRRGLCSNPLTASRGRVVLPSKCACFTRCSTCVLSFGSTVSSPVPVPLAARVRRSDGTLGANRVRRAVGTRAASATTAPSDATTPLDGDGSPDAGEAMASTMPLRRPGRRGPPFTSPGCIEGTQTPRAEDNARGGGLCCCCEEWAPPTPEKGVCRFRGAQN
mmetsp:Transcript_4218/g.15523  ORF Transcript_4218/g.15523 Transcript_4218/m.15523 type:complete len:258 (-) Transcript_4218:4630-5403(-)